MPGNLVCERLVITDDDDAVTPAHQFTADFPVAGGLRGLVMDGAIAANADIRVVEEIRNAARFGNGLLGFIRKAMEACGQSGQEGSFDV